jgi:hypothetical protein
MIYSKEPIYSAIPNHKRLVNITLLKSSSISASLYAEAYTNACTAVKFDTSANYIDAREAYKNVVKVLV